MMRVKKSQATKQDLQKSLKNLFCCMFLDHRSSTNILVCAKMLPYRHLVDFWTKWLLETFYAFSMISVATYVFNIYINHIISVLNRLVVLFCAAIVIKLSHHKLIFPDPNRSRLRSFWRWIIIILSNYIVFVKYFGLNLLTWCDFTFCVLMPATY